MIEKIDSLGEQTLNLIVKVLIPALVGIAIKIAVTMDKKKITFFNVVLSFITGVGFVFLLKGFVINNVNKDLQPALFGVIAMSGEYIGRLLISMFQIDIKVKVIIDCIIEFIGNLFGMGRIFKNVLTTMIGLVFCFVSFYFDLETWARVFFALLGVLLIASKDTLISRLGKIIDGALTFFNKK